jgi:6-phosphogluconolactonase (cycloisomerase 2 family)
VRKQSLLLSSLAVALFTAAPSLYASGTGEFVYVESNLKAKNANSIYAFERQNDGSLIPVSGSPFLTGGAGVQDTSLNVGPYDSDQNLIANQDHSLLFAVNSGSDSIAVFNIHKDGSLTAIAGSPFGSGGNDPVSLGLMGNNLIVVNKNGDFPRVNNTLPNYITFHINADGSLVHNPGHSAVGTAIGSSPTQAFLAPASNLLFGADFLGGLLQRMRVGTDGQLYQYAPSPLPSDQFPGAAAPPLPLGLWAHPTQPLLYVGFVTANTLGVYQYAENLGAKGPDYGLRFLRAVPNSGKAICWLRTNRSGTRLYSSDTITNSISVYDLSDPATPVQMQELNLEGPGNALQFELSSDGNYIYAISSRGSSSIPDGQGNALHILKIAKDGTVEETGASPILFSLPDGTRPQGVAVVDIN